MFAGGDEMTKGHLVQWGVMQSSGRPPVYRLPHATAQPYIYRFNLHPQAHSSFWSSTWVGCRRWGSMFTLNFMLRYRAPPAMPHHFCTGAIVSQRRHACRSCWTLPRKSMPRCRGCGGLGMEYVEVQAGASFQGSFLFTCAEVLVLFTRCTQQHRQ